MQGKLNEKLFSQTGSQSASLTLITTHTTGQRKQRRDIVDSLPVFLRMIPYHLLLFIYEYCFVLFYLFLSIATVIIAIIFTYCNFFS